MRVFGNCWTEYVTLSTYGEADVFFLASVGEVFAAKALVCSQDDDSCDDYNDDDDDNDETYNAASGCIRK